MTDSYLHWFRQSAPYINTHRERIFVLALPAEALDHGNFDHLIHDINLLNSLGVKIVLAYGAISDYQRLLQPLGEAVEFINDRVILSGQQINQVKAAIGAASIDISARFSMGLPNSPMHHAKITIAMGNFIRAKPLGIINGKDSGHSGEVRHIDSGAILDRLNHGEIVLLPSLGYSPSGEVFDLSLYDVAQSAAIALKADKLILFTPKIGLVDQQNGLIEALFPHQIQNWLADQRNHANNPDPIVIKSLLSAHEACRGGVQRAHLVSYCEDGALLEELFTPRGRGTLVTAEILQLIKPATIEHVPGILSLIQPLEERGILVKRSRELIEAEIDHFLVVVNEDRVIGCAALYPLAATTSSPTVSASPRTSRRITQDDQYTNQNITPESFIKAGELVCVAIDDAYRRGELGNRLLQAIEKKAKQHQINLLYALTTHSQHWFLEHGFEAVAPSELPPARHALYNQQRNSKVLKKIL